MQLESDRDTKYDVKRLKKIMLNHQEWKLIKELVFILKDFTINKDSLFKDYNYFIQLNFAAFKYLIIIINNKALKKVKKE